MYFSQPQYVFFSTTAFILCTQLLQFLLYNQILHVQLSYHYTLYFEKSARSHLFASFVSAPKVLPNLHDINIYVYEMSQFLKGTDESK